MVSSVVIARVGQSPVASKEGQVKCENYLPEILYNTAGQGYLTGEPYCLVDFRKMKSAGKIFRELFLPTILAALCLSVSPLL